MPAPAVKFCGLTRPEDAERGAMLGAAYLGVIFAGGPRVLTAARAALVLRGGSGRMVPGERPRSVGVFGEQSPAEVADMAGEAGLDVVQLHGDPDVAHVERVRAEFRGNVWAVLRVEGAALPRETLAALLATAEAVVLDAKVAGQLGGTGVALEWEALRERVAQAREDAGGAGRLVLAGGLTPENVGRAVMELGPDVVDVSSGVERSTGIKDHDRMRAFALAARARDA